MPKRAARPRRKPAKGSGETHEGSPVPPPVEPSSTEESAEAASLEAPKVDDIIAEAGPIKGERGDQAQSQEQEAVAKPAPIVETEEAAVNDEKEDEHPEESKEESVMEEEDEEEARKKRVAERLAKMGGVNPMTLPVRRTSVDDAASGNIASPSTSPPVSKPLRRASAGFPISSSSLSPPPAAKSAALKRASVGPISSTSEGPGIVGSVESSGSGSGRRASVGSTRSAKREDIHEVSEIVEEPEEMTEHDHAVEPNVQVKEGIRRKSDDENDGKY